MIYLYKYSSLLLLSAFIIFSAVEAQESEISPRLPWDTVFEARANSWQPFDTIFDLAGLEEGMKVAEVGASTGRVAVQIARWVGDSGMVYANDIDEEALDILEQRCEYEGISNLICVRGTETDTRLPLDLLDAVFLVSTYHCIEEPYPVLIGTYNALKPDGLLVIIDPESKKLEDLGLENWMAIPIKEILKTTNKAGFVLKREEHFLIYDHFLIFDKR